MKRNFNYRARLSLPLVLKGDRSAGDEVHLKGIPDRGRVLLFAQAGGAKPIAATETDAGCLAAAWGGLEGSRPHQADGSPPQRLPARTAASDGQRIFTRAARRRRAQVCGEVTVRKQWTGKRQSPAPVLAPHPPRSGPPSPQGEGHKRGRIGARLSLSGAAVHCPLSTVHSENKSARYGRRLSRIGRQLLTIDY